jgi:hypothetical protein
MGREANFSFFPKDFSKMEKGGMGLIHECKRAVVGGEFVNIDGTGLSPSFSSDPCEAEEARADEEDGGGFGDRRRRVIFTLSAGSMIFIDGRSFVRKSVLTIGLRFGILIAASYPRTDSS